MKLYLYPNISSERYIEKVRSCIEKLVTKGYECFLSEEDSQILKQEIMADQDILKDCDLIVTLGGDGTFLRGAQIALEYDMPVCGINCGHLGYLCAYSYDNIDDIDFSELQSYEVSLLEYDDGERAYALNDIVIGKDYFGGTVSLSVKVDGNKLYDFIGDGLIISTPLGSTAYNYSAGGKKLDIDSHKLAITPICAHTRDACPVQVNDDVCIEVELLKEHYSASTYIDGVKLSGLRRAEIKLSERKLKMLTK